MSEITKPLSLLEKQNQSLKAPWLGEEYSFIRHQEKTPFSLIQSVLFSLDENNIDKLFDEILDLLKKKGAYDPTELSKKLYEKSLYNNKFKIIFPENGNILAGIMVPKNINKTIAIPLFSKKIRDNFTENSYLFTFTNLLYEYIDNRYDYKMTELEIKELYLNIDNEEDVLEQAKDLYKKLNFKKKYLIIDNLLNKEKDFYIPINFLSDILKINIILLVAWNNNVSIRKIINNDNINPYIMIFNSYDKYHYEAASLKSKKDIVKIIFPKDDLLDDFMDFYNSEKNKRIEENYEKYLDLLDKDNRTAKKKYLEYLENLGPVKTPYYGDLENILKDLENDKSGIKDIIAGLNIEEA